MPHNSSAETLPHPQDLRQARVAADFGRAAAGYDRAARLQQYVGQQLLGLFSPASTSAPGVGQVLDLGCGTGYFLPLLAQQLAPVQLNAVDLSPAMLAYARDTRAVSAAFIPAPAEAVPLPSHSQDRVFSSLMLQWCPDLPRVAQEIRRLLAPGGEAVLSTLVDGTLGELKDAWSQIDPGVEHVNRFLPGTTLEQQLRSVFPGADVHYETVTLWYPDALALLRELKDLGARHKDGGRRSVTSPGRLRALNGAYEQYRQPERGLPASYQVAYLRVTRPLSDG
ncbi:MAG: malonyl-[acyl-carrier protein] O-methyltransferase BioC [Halomonadaceae bacterium]|nr:MAG: malonyl-[acyl-carrier protein] O-methyltransferase BioC [Halomonadaceae bacterium]